MQIHVHLMLGNIIRKHLESHTGIELDKQSYLFGNIRPDVSPDSQLTPFTKEKSKVEHFPHKSLDYLITRVNNLIDRMSREDMAQKAFSLELGHITHYFSDYFCYAHCDGFPDNLLKHYLYESNQGLFLVKHLTYFMYKHNTERRIAHIPKQQIKPFFEAIYQNYRSKKVSYKNDLEFAIKFGIALNVAVVSNITVKDIRTQTA